MPRKGSRKDVQDEIRQKVRRAILTAAPSEAEDAIKEALGDEMEIPAIANLAAGLIGGQIVNRATMYPQSAYSTYENNVLARERDEGVTLARRVLEEGDNCEDCVAAGGDEFVPLDELPEIGDSVCGCVTTGDSRVLTDRGWIPITLVEEGDSVLTHRGRWQRVLATSMKHSIPSHRFVSVSAPSGRWVGFTDDHRLLTPIGWRAINSLLRNELPVYNYRHVYRHLSEVQPAYSEGHKTSDLPPVREGMSLREAEGPQGGGVRFVRDESQGQGTVGEAARRDDGWNYPSRQASAITLRGSELGIELASTATRRADGNLLLGRGSETPHLPLSVGLDKGSRSNSRGLLGSPQERRSDTLRALAASNPSGVGGRRQLHGCPSEQQPQGLSFQPQMPCGARGHNHNNQASIPLSRA